MPRLHGCGAGFGLGLAGGLLAAASTVLAGEPARPSGSPDDPLARAGGRIAWRASLAVKFTASIRAYRLVDEYLYGIGTDGLVWAIRADTGKHVWTEQLADPENRLHAPVAYRVPGVHAVAFTGSDKVVFLDPATGLELETTEQDEEGQTRTRQIGPVRLRSAPLAPVAASMEYVFAVAPGHRLRCYEIADGYESWQVDASALLRLAPVYLAGPELVLMADTSGLVAGLNAGDGKKRFAQQLQGEPIGWLTADDGAVYVATSARRVYAVALATGEVALEYYLPELPTGGPIVTETSIYQATTAGVQRVGKQPGGRNWLAPGASAFLAEWPGRVVLLGRDGKIAFVKSETGESLAEVNPGGRFDGVSNPRNDAVILTSPRGEVVCLRPIGAGLLMPADFRPPPLPLPESPESAGDLAKAEEQPEKEATPEASAEGAVKPAEPAGAPLSLEERLLANPLRPLR